MATIRLCDWTKKRIGKDEPTYKVTIEDQEFEVSDEGMELLLNQLGGDEEPAPFQNRLPRLVPVSPLDEQQREPVKDAIGREEESTLTVEDNLPEPVMADGNAPAIEIPDDTRKPFKKPPVKLAEQIVAESTIAEEGSLPTLSMGQRAHKEAMKRLQDLEDKANDKLRRKAQKGVNIGFDNEYRPR